MGATLTADTSSIPTGHDTSNPIGLPKALARKATRRQRRPRQATVGQAVTRKVDSSGNVSFAASNYSVGLKHRRRQVQVAIVGGTVEISSGGEVIKVHPIRHDRSREHGAFSNPGGRPRRINAA